MRGCHLEIELRRNPQTARASVQAARNFKRRPPMRLPPQYGGVAGTGMIKRCGTPGKYYSAGQKMACLIRCVQIDSIPDPEVGIDFRREEFEACLAALEILMQREIRPPSGRIFQIGRRPARRPLESGQKRAAACRGRCVGARRRGGAEPFGSTPRPSSLPSVLYPKCFPGNQMQPRAPL